MNREARDTILAVAEAAKARLHRKPSCKTRWPRLRRQQPAWVRFQASGLRGGLRWRRYSVDWTAALRGRSDAGQLTKLVNLVGEVAGCHGTASNMALYLRCRMRRPNSDARAL
jgi:hypothetical protein